MPRISKGENEMKEWQEPSLEIQVFGVEDVMTTSGPGTGDQGTPWV